MTLRGYLRGVHEILSHSFLRDTPSRNAFLTRIEEDVSRLLHVITLIIDLMKLNKAELGSILTD